jgi:MFS family permease
VQAGTHSFAEMAILRFFLGTVDAGLAPGLVFFLTFWYRARERSVRIALFASSVSLAGAVGGLIAYAIGYMNGVNGLSAWRWLLILEGVPSCVYALLVWYAMPDYPESTSWLSAEEKELAEKRLRVEGSKGSAPGLTWKDIKITLTDWRLYGHYLVCRFFSASLFWIVAILQLYSASMSRQRLKSGPSCLWQWRLHLLASQFSRPLLSLALGTLVCGRK